MLFHVTMSLRLPMTTAQRLAAQAEREGQRPSRMAVLLIERALTREEPIREIGQGGEDQINERIGGIVGNW